MAEDWYYALEGERHGPVSGRDLKRLANVGKLKPTDLVWRRGMADWRAAGSIRGLFVEGATSGRRSPPPLSKDQPASPPKGESDLGRIAQKAFDEIKMRATDVAVKATAVTLVKAKAVAKTFADALAQESVAEKVRTKLDSSNTTQESETNDSSQTTPHMAQSDASDEPGSKGAEKESAGALWKRFVQCLKIVWDGSKAFWLRYAAWLLQFFRILRSGEGSNKKASETATVSKSEGIQLSLMDVFRSDATEHAKNVPNAVMLGNICHWLFVFAVVCNCFNVNRDGSFSGLDGTWVNVSNGKLLEISTGKTSGGTALTFEADGYYSQPFLLGHLGGLGNMFPRTVWGKWSLEDGRLRLEEDPGWDSKAKVGMNLPMFHNAYTRKR